MFYFYVVLSIYFAVISLVAVGATIRDKRLAQKNKWRVKEKTLLLISAMGGAVAMLLTMHLVRHKTKHAKFMLGIPLIILLQVAVIVGIAYLAMS